MSEVFCLLLVASLCIFVATYKIENARNQRRDRRLALVADARGMQKRSMLHFSPGEVMHRAKASGEINPQMTDYIRTVCGEAKAANAALELTIDTYGGLYEDAEAIGKTLNDFAQRHRLRLIVAGNCQSSGVTIATSVPIECRFGTSDTTFMVHAVKYRYGRGIIRLRTKSTRKLDAKLLNRLTNATCIDKKSLQALFHSGRDHFFGAKKALELGVIGAII